MGFPDTKGATFRDNGDGIEMFVDGIVVAKGEKATAEFKAVRGKEMQQAQAVALEPRTVLSNLTQAQAAKLLDLIGVEHKMREADTKSG